MSRSIKEDEVTEQHFCDVHLNCPPESCPYAGKIFRFHSHDYSGPIVCCDDE